MYYDIAQRFARYLYAGSEDEKPVVSKKVEGISWEEQVEVLLERLIVKRTAEVKPAGGTTV